MNVTFFPLGVVDANCCVLCTEDKQGAVIDPGSYNAVLEKAIRESGFDQGRLLARGLSSYFGAECVPLFLRVGGKDQKKLDRRKRKKNADLHIKLNENMKGFPKNFKETDLPSFIEGKNIIIVDDVLTSGATLRRGVELLLPLRPANTVVSCVAKSVKNDKRLKN